MNGSRLLLLNTTAFVCAVVFLFYAGIALAQEAQEESVPLQTQEAQSDASLSYTTELIEDTFDGRIPGDFVVGPGKVELTLEPGMSRTVELLVTNRTGALRQFNFEVEDATGSYDLEKPVVLLGNDRGPYTLRDYFTFPNASIELEHNERARVPVTISIPADAEAGGKYGSVLVTTVTKDAQLDPNAGASAASAIVSRVGTLFFVTIPGEVYTEGELAGFATLPEGKVFTDGPINFQVLYENKGNIHVNPYGEIRITNLFNEEVGFIELDPWFVFPQSLRMREVSWDRELLIGRYTATLHLNRGYDDVIDTQEITFWVLPWKIVASVFVVLFLVFFALRFIGKNFEFKRKNT